MTNIHTISSSVTAFLDLLSQADAVMADSSPLLISWDVTEPTGSPSNELVRLRWEEGGQDYALVLTEEGIAAGRWQGDKYLCLDCEGDEVEISLNKLTPLKPTMCKQCGSHLDGDYCSDETCVFSDWPQSVEREDLSVFATDEIEEKYGVQKRAATAL